MEIKKVSTVGMAALIAVSLLSSTLAFAEKQGPLTPQLAAKKENYRKQEEQRVTPTKRKAATDALKAERIKIYKAKQEKQAREGKKSDRLQDPTTNDSK